LVRGRTRVFPGLLPGRQTKEERRKPAPEAGDYQAKPERLRPKSGFLKKNLAGYLLNEMAYTIAINIMFFFKAPKRKRTLAADLPLW
jgi:hypothetical protein